MISSLMFEFRQRATAHGWHAEKQPIAKPRDTLRMQLDQMCSILERVAHQDGVVALGAGGEQRHRALDQLLDGAHVLDGLGRQLGPAARAARRLRPALEALVDRLDAGLRVVAGRQAVDALAVERVADADLELSKPSSTSSLVSAMPSMPATLMVWRTRQASNQPQRRLRPVTTPNSWPRSPSLLADRVGQLGRERPGADARGVGLGDAQHVADRRAGPMPEPVAACAATVLEEVTNG